MKITCQSCQAKYTIADEKVAGKTVKIKCKKCGAAIVVQGGADQPQGGGYDAGYGPPADGDDGAETRVFGEQAGAPAPDEWRVNVAEGDERTMSTAQLAAEYQRGALSDDTYVWREGMSDWLPIASVPELAPYAPAAAAAAAPAAAPEPALGLMGTVVMDSSPMAAPRGTSNAPRPISTPPAAARPASAPPPAAAAAAPAAARRAGKGGGVDLFGGERADAGGASASAPPPGDRQIGERNENSVLFSLSALTAAETATKASSKKDEAVLDLRPGGGPRPGPGPAKNNGRAGLDDIMNLGGGGLGAPMLAPPPLLAPVVGAPPPPPVAAAAPAGGMGMGAPLAIPDMPQKKSPVGLIIGAVAAVAVIGAVLFFVMQKPAEQTTSTGEQTNTAAPTTTTPAAPATTAAAAPTDTAPAPTETAKPAETAAVAAATPQTGPKPPGGPSGPATSKTAEAKEPDKPPPVETAKPAETAAAASGGAEFNRGAATAALGAAAGAAKSCKKPDGPTGSGKVKVTFAPSGNVTSAQVQGPPFAGTPVGGCVAGVFRGARVPPFDGAPVSVTKSFNIN
ncbi:MAG: zinc-ribbon domain-containing protein [Polyangiaceae bacterium]|nr:zinc-ribbon domain-containing protein [Polyangiaceae bacterium]